MQLLFWMVDGLVVSWLTGKVMGFPMLAKIANGFPVRRCSWFFNPIVPGALSRKMIRWLDFVCLKPPIVRT